LTRRRWTLAATTLIALATLALAGPTRADWKILYYDKSGRLLGVDGGAPDGSGGTAGSEGAGGQTGGEGASGGSAGFGADGDGRTSGQGGRGQSSANLPQEQRFEPGEILVSDPPDGFEMRARQLGFTVLDKVTLRALSVDVFRLRVPRGSSVPAAVTSLRRQFPGLSVDANHLFDPTRGGRTPELFARSVMGWGVASSKCGHGVRIGVIDGAVDLDHPALEGRSITYRAFHAPGRRPGAMEHGTAIAAMLIGQSPWGGLMPAAELKHASIFELNNEGQVVASVFGLVKAVDWVIDQKVHVINLSVAGSSNQVLDQVLIKARRNGQILVAAAGNGGPDAPPAYPAAYDYVIAVTAVDAYQHLYEYANRGTYIEFAAPGVAMWTAVPGGGRLQSGTSFAAPYISVLVAQQIARGGGADLDAVRRELMDKLLDLGTPGRDDQFGWGLVRHPRDCRPQIAG
jgi:subtilisin family serine protease